MRQARNWFFLLPLFLVLTCVGAFAQANSSITGIVTDQTGAAVPGAEITITDPATGAVRTATSGSTGLYTIAGLNAAHYNMTVAAKGFEAYTQRGVVVDISMTFRVDIKLTVGAATQTVTVEADALTVQSDSNVVSTLINQQQITDLPTNGRNVISLATFGLGISGNLPDMESAFSVNANYAISFNGLSQAHNIWIIDGGEAYDRGSGGKMSVMPSQDALSEFQVLSSNYPPDYGQASGGTITMSIKSGTRKFHGEAWEFDRNNALDARNYFNQAPQQVAEFRYNVFGANLGGPITIPHVYNSSRKKTFFFVNEEWRKEVDGQSPNPIQTMPSADIVTSATNFNYVIPHFDATGTVATVPTVSANSRLGQAITAYNVGATNPLVMGSPFPGGMIPGALLDANALRFNATQNLPASTTANGTYSPSGGHLPINVREDLFRIDHNINDKWQIFGHYIHDSSDTIQATPEWQGDNYPTIGSNFSNPSYSSVIKLTGSLTPNVLVEAAFNYDGNKIAILPVSTVAAGFTKPTGWSTGTYFPAANDIGNRLPDIKWDTIGTTWGPGNDPWTNGAEDFNEVGSISVTAGRHNLKFGGEFNRYTKNQVIGKDSEGDYEFGDGWNAGAGTPSGQLTGDSYLDFLLGTATSFSQSNANPINHYVNNTISVYAQDNWHVTDRLSLQYGIRYDVMPLTWERNNDVSNFDPSKYQAADAPTFNADGSFASSSAGIQTFTLAGVATPFYMNGIVLAGQEGTPRGLGRQDYKTVMPRIGFSYDMFGNGKTVLRGGAGTFYERVQGNDIYDAAGAPPFISTPSANDAEFTNPSANWQSGLAAATPSFPQGYNSFNTYYPHPAVAQYSLGVQHQIAQALILTTQYVGNIEWHQNVWLPINDFPLSTPEATREAAANGSLSTLASQGDVTYPGFGKIRLQSNTQTGSYNSAQIGLRQQSRHGLSYEIDYTYSHQIDSTPDSVDVDNNNPTSNPWNSKYDKGSGALDRRQVLSINYEYHLPIFNQSTGLTHAVLGGWELSGTVISETGLPWFGNHAPNGNNPDSVGLGGDYQNRDNFTGKPDYAKAKTANGYQYVTNAGFSAPTPSWMGGPNLGFGSAGKDVVVGAGRTDFSTALTKSFAFTRTARFEAHIETFNTFNHTQFNGLQSTNWTSGNFGITNSAQAEREFELGGKFVF